MKMYPSWLLRMVEWLDEQGKLAWIAIMVVAFIVFWPLGLVILAFLIWSGRMCSKTFRRLSRGRAGSTGNSAFDSYREETLQRLEQEEKEFRSFLRRLREAKDKAEFERFLNERSQQA